MNGTSITSNLMLESNNKKQATADPLPHHEYPWPSNNLCHRCEHVKMSVTLLPCQHAALCNSCAEVIMKLRKKKCPFCKQHVTDIIRVIQWLVIPKLNFSSLAISVSVMINNVSPWSISSFIFQFLYVCIHITWYKMIIGTFPVTW